MRARRRRASLCNWIAKLKSVCPHHRRINLVIHHLWQCHPGHRNAPRDGNWLSSDQIKRRMDFVFLQITRLDSTVERIGTRLWLLRILSVQRPRHQSLRRIPNLLQQKAAAQSRALHSRQHNQGHFTHPEHSKAP